MSREIISKATRNEFREVLVGFTLREIEMIFEAAHMEPRVDYEPPVSGQRRSLIEQYYANIDFSSQKDVRKLLNAYEELIEQLQQAQALCKLEGFTYAPSDAHYWMHGHSTERDFIYVTTANLNHEQLQQLSDEVGADRSLLVLCSAFRSAGVPPAGGRDVRAPSEYPNLTVKKIPKQVLSRCEWGHDDYSLRVDNLPQAPAKPGQQALFEEGA